MSNPKLDEIQARADAAQGAWEEFQQGIVTTRFALEEANNSAEDVKPLVSALRAVEELCTTSEEHAEEYGDTPTIYVDSVRTAIREALG